MTTLPLSCRCGEVTGIVKDVTNSSGNRLICCCSDCQAFVSKLMPEDNILDAHGGTDIYQTSPASIEITTGREKIRYLRLTEKGTFRWYADCCKTPIGNTLGPKMPFVGLIHGFWAEKPRWEEVVGPPSARVQTKYALNLPADAPKPVGFPLGVTLKIMLKILGWKMFGKGKPNPFFDPKGRPLPET